MRHFGVIVVVAALAGAAFGQNLLVNPSFSDPPAVQDCGVRNQLAGSIPGWTQEGSAPARVNGDFHIPPCGDAHAGDTNYAGFQISGPAGGGSVYQTINVTPGTTYRLNAQFYLGTSDTAAGVRAYFSVYAGSGTFFFTPIKQVIVVKKNKAMYRWEEVSLTVTPTTAQIQPRIQFEAATASNNAFHFDNASFQVETVCTNQPTMNMYVTGNPNYSPLTPSVGARGETVAVTLAGTGFAGTPTAQLVQYGGARTINATSVIVNSDTQAVATFNIPADAAADEYDLIYSQAPCAPIVLPGAFTVQLGGFTNGSFEIPAVANCGTPIDVRPDGWLVVESNNWGFEGLLKLNGFAGGSPLDFLPSCPAPDGSQYATIASIRGSGEYGNANGYQTFTSVPGTKYTLSGFFAGTGPTIVSLNLRDGAPGGPLLATTQIYSSTTRKNYDWKFNYVTLPDTPPVGSSMTAEWHVSGRDTGQRATHADKLQLEVCTTPAGEITSISPTTAANDGVMHATITGTGFSGNPTVILGGKIGTNVVVNSPTQITCDFDMTGVMVGRYDLFVKLGGCVSSLPAAVGVAARQFVNGGFEDPFAELDCGPPSTNVGGIPTGWIVDRLMNRDGNAPAPPSCPSPAGGHYGTMASTGGGTFRAWQTILVEPGRSYQFSGWFTGAADCTIRLLDGDETGTELASKVVYTNGNAAEWIQDSVSAPGPASQMMTAVWEISNATEGSPGGHADGLSFGTTCNTIWADADDDLDVDMDDFGAFQLCYTGQSGPLPANVPYCQCFDRGGDGAIGESDFVAFQKCVSGPSIPWTACEP